MYTEDDGEFEILLLSYSEKDSTVPGYDFLVNSVWPEIVQGLEDKLPSLFNPGDPDAFHEVLFLCHLGS